MKQVIYWNNTAEAWYMTSRANYNSYFQDARRIHALRDVKTLDDVMELIERLCELYDDDLNNYEIILNNYRR